MSHPTARTTDENTALKERVHAFWQAHPCGTKFSDVEMGTREFFERVEAHRYEKEWHIPEAADFAGARGLRVLEVGCGLGTDGAQRAVHEIHRVLRPGGRAIVMLYHRDSYNYRVGIRVLRRAGARLLKSEIGIKFVHHLTGEPVDSLREYATLLRTKSNGYLSSEEFLSQSTDGAGNPLARVYSRRQASELFRDFCEVRLQAYFLNKRFVPLLGSVLPRSIESMLAARWGWHLWIYATK